MSVVKAPTVADAIRAQARIRAAYEIIKEAETEVRTFLTGEAMAVSEATGATFNAPLKGVGRAYMTEPGYRVEIDDEARIAEFVEAQGWGPVVCRRSVDCSALQSDVDAGEADVVEALDRWGYLRTEAAFSETVPDMLLELPWADDGSIVDPGTGEALPARAVAKSESKLTIRVEAAAVQKAKVELLERMRPVLMPGRDR